MSLPSPIASLLAALWNRRERRLRMPFRLVAVALVVVLFGWGTGLLFAALADQSPGVALSAAVVGATSGALFDLTVRVVSASVGAVTTVLAALVIAVAIDRRSFADYGFHLDADWWRDFGFGAALGAALMTLVFVVGLAVGWVRVAGVVATASGLDPGVLVVAYALTFAAVSLSEELLVRGVLLTNLAEGLGGFGPLSNRAGTVLAVGLTSILFGVLHVGNPNATLLSTANIALAGVFLALGYVLTGDLAVPLGLHLTWNYVQGVVYGFPVSGMDVGVALVDTEVTGPPLVTGGRFGPEAGLLGVGAILVGSAAIAWWVQRYHGSISLSEAVWTPELRTDPDERGR